MRNVLVLGTIIEISFVFEQKVFLRTLLSFCKKNEMKVYDITLLWRFVYCQV